MNNREFIKKLEAILATRTVYMWGTFGAPVTESLIQNKSKQYPTWYTAAKQRALRDLIGRGYFAFDCIGLIKAVHWGWDGSNKNASGGAVYASNGMPDTNANGYINTCKNVSTNFSNLEAGEVVWMPGHIGVYVGNGEVIEATPSWKNGVQRTKLSARKWQKHGFMPQLTYVEEAPEIIEILRTKENLNLRQGAGTNYKILLTMPKGVEVRVLNKSNGWAKVAYKNSIGYCSTSYLEAVQSRKGGKVSASVLNVRSGPSTKYRVVGQLTRGTSVEILNTQNGWHNIRYGLTTAWVSADYIEESNEVVAVQQKGKVTASIGLNVRNAPGGKVVGAYKFGEVVTILGREGSWYKTPQGYCSINYINLI